MKSEKNNQNFIAEVFKQFSRVVSQAGPYMTASYTLIGSILLLTSIGYLADMWLGTSPVLLILGVILGIAIGLYEVAKITLKK